jgi:hypothetical protein
MPVPLIAAAASVVARYIAKKGLQAAGKKFTKRAIAEGKKHAKDMVTKPNAGQAQVKAATKGQRAYRSGTRVAAGVGAAAGATGGVVAMKNKVKDMRSKLKLAKTEMERAKTQTAIEKTLAKIMLEEQKAKPTAQAPKKSPRPKARPQK